MHHERCLVDAPLKATPGLVEAVFGLCRVEAKVS
jgi:hypothetical protein